MSKYKYEVDFGNGETMESEDVFDTFEEAEEAAQVVLSDFSAGAEILELMGEEFDDPDKSSFSIFQE